MRTKPISSMSFKNNRRKRTETVRIQTLDFDTAIIRAEYFMLFTITPTLYNTRIVRLNVLLIDILRITSVQLILHCQYLSEEVFIVYVFFVLFFQSFIRVFASNFLLYSFFVILLFFVMFLLYCYFRCR